MSERIQLKATRLRSMVVLCATLLSTGGVVAVEQNSLQLNGIELNGVELNGLSLNEAAEKRAGGDVKLQSRETEAARVWDSVRQLSKESLGQKK